MRHRKKVNKLSRKAEHRKSMLSNLACSLIKHKRIFTTLAKAKALRPFIEPLITKSKNDTTHSRRTVFRYLKDKTAVSTLFREIANKVLSRPGGYTRILKTRFRPGDSAEMCIIELVDYSPELVSTIKEAETKIGEKRKHTRRGRRKKAEEQSKSEEEKR